MKNRSLAVVSGLLISPLVFAAPQNGSVQAGTATISQFGTQTTINQTSQNAVINWGSFDTASNESVQFQQPNATSITLNRITSGLPTNFAGSLTANGRIFIVNPSGIVFAKGSKVDAAGLIATTADINDNDFMNGAYKFALPKGSENSSIINNGTLTAEDQGIIALIAPNVQNGDSGIIQANCGTVNLSTGKSFVVDFNGDSLINFDASSAIDTGSIKSSGKIVADGGKILMTNNAVSQTLDNVISISGIVEAGTSEPGQNGEVILTNSNGAIIETDSGKIITPVLKTNSAIGTMLNSKDNMVTDFSATNTVSGDVSLATGADYFGIDGITQSGGNLNILSANGISQGNDSSDAISVSGASTISAGYHNGASLMNSANKFVGPVSISTQGSDVSLSNSINLILGNWNVRSMLIQDNFAIYNAPASNISQLPNTALVVSGDANISTSNGTLVLTNAGNQFSGKVSLANEGVNNPLSFYNSISTVLQSASSRGIITITTNGQLTIGDGLIFTYAKTSPNAHTIIFVAQSFLNDGFFSQTGNIEPGKLNSWLIYLPNPSAVLPGSYPIQGNFGVDLYTSVYGQTYLSAPPSTISVGNHYVYASNS